MKVAVIGSTGQLGQDLMRVFSEEAVGFAHRDLDVTDGAGVASAIKSAEPDWVGALNVARAAADIGSGVVFYSTDYVFGGQSRERDHPYEEGDGPQPLSVYGASKVAGEQLVMQANARHIVVRSAGLYGTATSRKGWTFPELMLNKARTEGVIRVVTDQVLSPTFTADLARKTRELLEHDARGLFHLTNTGECSWFEFARGALDTARVEAEMEPIDSALTTARLEEIGLSPLRSWQDALSDYLHTKGAIP